MDLIPISYTKINPNTVNIIFKNPLPSEIVLHSDVAIIDAIPNEINGIHSIVELTEKEFAIQVKPEYKQKGGIKQNGGYIVYQKIDFFYRALPKVEPNSLKLLQTFVSVKGRISLPALGLGFSGDIIQKKNEIAKMSPNQWTELRNVFSNEMLGGGPETQGDTRLRVNVDKPPSRASYKLMEIIARFDLLPLTQLTGDPLYPVFLAERPGGFIYAYLRHIQLLGKRLTDKKQIRMINKLIKKTEQVFTITLKKPGERHLESYQMLKEKLQSTIPEFNLDRFHEVYGKNLETNEELGGDLTDVMTLKSSIETIRKISNNKGAKLVTADGGFFELDIFPPKTNKQSEKNEITNAKEQIHTKLFLSEILAALKLLRPGGHFVLKMYDTVTPFSAKLLGLLSERFRQVYLFKGYDSSRSLNSEKYIICKFYLDEPTTTEIVDEIINRLPEIKLNYTQFTADIFDGTLPNQFIQAIRNANLDFNQRMLNYFEGSFSLKNSLDTAPNRQGLIQRQQTPHIQSAQKLLALLHQKYITPSQ